MKFFILTILTTFLPLLTHAQDKPTGRTVTLRLLAFQSQQTTPDLYAADAASPNSLAIAAPLKNYLNHESVQLTLTENEIAFLKSAATADRAKPIAKAKLPAKGKQFIIVVFPGPEDKPLPTMVIDDSLAAFPLGSFLVANLCGQTVRVTLEEKPYDSKPGQTLIIKDAPMRQNMHAGMNAFIATDGKAERIGAGMWPHPGKKRDLQFFFANPLTKRIEMRGFRDISPPSAVVQ